LRGFLVTRFPFTRTLRAPIPGDAHQQEQLPAPHRTTPGARATSRPILLEIGLAPAESAPGRTCPARRHARSFDPQILSAGSFFPNRPIASRTEKSIAKFRYFPILGDENPSKPNQIGGSLALSRVFPIQRGMRLCRVSPGD
jgi:hypothetical protein